MDLGQDVKQSLVDAAEIINKSSYVVVLTGAGVSVESNIRPFRGPGGLWTEKGEPPMNGYQRLIENPKKYWENRLNRQKKSEFGNSLSLAKPNPGHIALAELEEMGIVKSLITQNIDNLHRAAGSKNVLEIHGNMQYLRCIKCGQKWKTTDYKIENVPPTCSTCGGLVKGDTVMFGEPIPRQILNKCLQEANKSDCMITIGTSATVHPAASLPIITKRNGGYVIEVNPYTTEISSICDVTIQAQSGETLPILVDEIKKIKKL